VTGPLGRPVATPALVLILAGSLAAACTGAGIGPLLRSPGSAQAAGEGRALCHRALPTKNPSPGTPQAPPPEIQRVADGVEEVRGLMFREPVPAEAVSRERLQRVIIGSIATEFPQPDTERRQRAWQAIGAIPGGADLEKAVRDLAANQILGLYDTTNDRLLFLGDDVSSPLERFVLSHELTHALDDQWFDLGRADTLARECRDDRLDAFVALAEGDAQTTSTRWAGQNFSAQDFVGLSEAIAGFAPPPDTVPPFVQSLLIFPYPNGQAFVTALLDRGGRRALDDAFRNPPVSTEQILHPDRYPDDQPQSVDPPKLATRLGAGWEEIDVQDVGEGWLELLLELRLGSTRAALAAAGWDGGRYRAFAKGDSVGVVLETEWDSDRDAGEFGDAITEWSGAQAASVTRDGDRIRVLFGSDHPALAALEAATGS